MNPSKYLLLLVAIAIKPYFYAFSFSIQPFTTARSFAPHIAKIRSHHNIRLQNQVHYGRSKHALQKLSASEGGTSNDGDDDGWGDEPTETSSIPAEPLASSLERTTKSQELARLQNDLATKQSRQVSSGSVNSSGTGSGGERDLFIPIVTLVSVIGFTGLYGYEMLRLYSRGELYLPWEN